MHSSSVQWALSQWGTTTWAEDLPTVLERCHPSRVDAGEDYQCQGPGTVDSNTLYASIHIHKAHSKPVCVGVASNVSLWNVQINAQCAIYGLVLVDVGLLTTLDYRKYNHMYGISHDFSFANFAMTLMISFLFCVSGVHVRMYYMFHIRCVRVWWMIESFQARRRCWWQQFLLSLVSVTAILVAQKEVTYRNVGKTVKAGGVGTYATLDTKEVIDNFCNDVSNRHESYVIPNMLAKKRWHKC